MSKSAEGKVLVRILHASLSADFLAVQWSAGRTFPQCVCRRQPRNVLLSTAFVAYLQNVRLSLVVNVAGGLFTVWLLLSTNVLPSVQDLLTCLYPLLLDVHSIYLMVSRAPFVLEHAGT
jgi:hypothetical protein